MRSAPPYRVVPTFFRLPPISDADVDGHISRALPANERKLMRAIMLQLPPHERYNVIYHAVDGTLHANKPALLDDVRVYQPSAGDSRKGVSVSGDTITLAPTMSIPASIYNCRNVPQSTSTGGYREVASICGTPYDYSGVYLPCRTTGDIYLHYPNNEGPYIYLGGFSTNGNAIDAGLQYGYKYDDWALFVRGSYGQVSNFTRFQCNQRITMEFYPVNLQMVAVDASGYTTSRGFQNITQTYGLNSSDGWSPYCQACVVKRVTSLAQNGFLNFRDGSWAGINTNTNPVIAWSNSYLGYWNGQTPARYNVSTWGNINTGGYYNYPSGDPSRILVNFINGGNETDGIYYH